MDRLRISTPSRRLAAALSTAALLAIANVAQAAPEKIASGLANPESVAVGFDGRLYFSIMGERDTNGDGLVGVLSKGKVTPFATGMDDPKGVVAIYDQLYVTDRQRVWVVDRDGKATVFAAKEAFPVEPLFLNDIAADQTGNLYVSDSGDRMGSGGKVYKITPRGEVTLIVDNSTLPELKMPNGVLIGRDGKLLLADFLSGILYRVSLEDGKHEKVAEGLGAADGIVEDAAGNLFISDNRGYRLFRVLPGNPKPVQLAEGFGAADICLSQDGTALLVPDMPNGALFRQTIAPAAAAAPIARDLRFPESAVVVAKGTYHVSIIGMPGVNGDGSIMEYRPGKPPKVVAKGLDDPKGIVLVGDTLYVADKTQVWKIAPNAKPAVFAAAEAFPRAPVFLNDIAADSEGTLYVSDSGDNKGKSGAIFAIAPDGEVSMLADSEASKRIKRPNGLLCDGEGGLLIVDILSGDLLRMNLSNKKLKRVAGGFTGGDGLALDLDGNLYISQWSTGQVSVLTPGSKEAKPLANQFVSAADICIDPFEGRVVVPDMKAGTLTGLPLLSHAPTEGVDQSPMEVRIEPAFPELSFERPLVLTHAGDGTNRVFVAAQRGRVYVFPNDAAVTEAKVFLDIVNKTAPYEKGNEEGLLGLAFHPKFKENGQFFVYYTSADPAHVSIVSRFTVDPKNPDAADAASEEVVFRLEQPYPNHNGGTIVFGPDGYLYIGLGDGGLRDDPHGNGQNLGTLLGSILRIDVDRTEGEKGYAIPKDNPFVGRDGACPEIWAHGVRNIWRLAFDRETGDCWAGEVGQNIWEEVILVTRGGNYGWNPREAMHRFTPNGSGPSAEFIEPVWEYHHDVGKSITGGNVYRGQSAPELTGRYLYADYVTGRIWSLAYDRSTRRVTENRPIFGSVAPVMSFGEDENGETYFLTFNGGMFRFASIASE